MRSAPAPDLLPIPGMNQGTAVAAGDGGGGGDDGSGGDGNDKEGAGGGQGGDDATGDSNEAPDPVKYPTCGTKAHPVDVVTGRAFTLPIEDLGLPGPLPFSFERTYSTTAAHQDMGLGWGWAHSLGWHVEVRRRSVHVWNDQGKSIVFPQIPVGASTLGDFGWVLRREAWGYGVDVDDGTWRLFADAKDERGETFLLSAIEDRNKNKITLTYDKGHLVEITDSAGRTIKVKNTSEGRIASLEVKNAETNGQWIAFATYRYDERGNLVQVTDADGYSWHYEYDEFHRLVKDKDRVGLTFHFKYDTKNRCIESWGDYDGKPDPSLADDVPSVLADGKTRAKGIHHCKFDYGQRRYTEVADSTQVSRFFGNARGQLGKLVDAGAVVTSEYDGHGHLVARTDGTGATTRWRRDERGRILERTDPLGRTTKFELDAYGLPVSLTDGSGAVSRVSRDQRGNPVESHDPLGAVRQITWDDRGLPTAVMDANGGITRYEYDAQGNRTRVTLPNGAVCRYGYDRFGRRVWDIDPAGGQRRWAYSNRGDLILAVDASSGEERYQYDGERHLKQMTSPAGRNSHYLWGGFHKLCGKQDALGRWVRLKYNREGEIVAVLNERGETHTFQRDAGGRLVGESTFDGRVLRYRNDARGRQVRIDCGGSDVTELVYDAAGQLVERKDAEGSETFEWDAAGRLLAASRNGIEVKWVRDAPGRVIEEIQTADGESTTVESRYDTVGDRVERRTSSGHVETVVRDVMGKRTSTLLDSSSALRHTNDAFGREVVRDLPDGGCIETAFGGVGGVVARRARSRSDLGEREVVTAYAAFSYDADGEIVRRRGALAIENVEYIYDPVGRLRATVAPEARGEAFSYDERGDIHEGERSTRTYAQGGRLVRRGDVEYTYDEGGRLCRRSRNGRTEWNYQWSGAGLLQAAESDHTRVEFGYDALARRIKKSVFVRPRPGVEWRTAVRVRFVWDANVLVHELRERSAAGGDPVIETRTYLFGDDTMSPLAHRDGAASWQHYVNDPIGTPEQLVDDSGRVVCRLVRASWGATVVEGKSETPIRFRGQYHDDETGLSYNRFRYYDPESGTYVSPDPIGLRGGLRPYGYVNNPIGWVDPFGLASGERGRRGVPATRDQLDQIRNAHLAAHPDHEHVGGGRDCNTGEPIPEEYIPGLEGGTRGSSYPDLSFRAPDGTMHRYNTYDTAPTRPGGIAYGGVPLPAGMSSREEENAVRIFQASRPGDTLTLIPKV